YYAVRDAVSHREHLLRGAELASQGFRVELGAYGCQVLLDWRELRDGDGLWASLHDRLRGGSVADLEAAWRDLRLEPVHAAYRRLVAPGRATALQAALAPKAGAAALRAFIAELAADLAQARLPLAGDVTAEPGRARLEDLARQLARAPVARGLRAELDVQPAAWGGLVQLLVDDALGAAARQAGDPAGLDHIRVALLRELGAGEDEARQTVDALRVSETLPAGAPLGAWLGDPAGRAMLRVHAWEGAEWLAREPYEALVRWWSVRSWLAGSRPAPSALELRRRGAAAGWRVDRMLAASTIRGRRVLG
ncbi:MAG: hypothetical protein ACRDGL_03690, partial [Candidatus Limnocylindrales bacterium]